MSYYQLYILSHLGESGGPSTSPTPMNGRDTEARGFLEGGAEPGRPPQGKPLQDFILYLEFTFKRVMTIH